MLDVAHSDAVFDAVDGAERVQSFPESCPLRNVPPGTALVVQGDRKVDLFRVVSGTLCAHATAADGRPQTITFYNKGDLIGSGKLSSYVWTVTAMTDAVVSRLPQSALDALAACEPSIAARREALTEIEFETLRRQLTRSGQEDRMVSVANLLIVLARTNAMEGGNAGIVRDDLGCGSVAQQLGLEIDELATALAGLRSRGLISAHADGSVRIDDAAGLERLADSV